MKKEIAEKRNIVELQKIKSSFFDDFPQFIGHIEIVSSFRKKDNRRYFLCNHLPSGEQFDQQKERLQKGILPPKYKLPTVKKSRKNGVCIQKVEEKMGELFPERTGKFEYLEVERVKKSRNFITVRHIETGHVWRSFWQNLYNGSLPACVKKTNSHRKPKPKLSPPPPKKEEVVTEVNPLKFVAFVRNYNETCYFEIAHFLPHAKLPEDIEVLRTCQAHAQLYVRVVEQVNIYLRRSHPMPLSVPLNEVIARTAWKIRKPNQLKPLHKILEECTK